MRLDDFKLERYFSKYEFVAPYLLCSSDCESLSVGELLKMEKGSESGLKSLRLGYTETWGGPELRKEVSGLYSRTKPDEILGLAGGEEGIFLFMNVLLKKGDHIIVQFPAYQSLYGIADSIGCRVTRWRVRHEDGWELDTGFLRKSITRRTKAIVLNLPHNPTGYLPSKKKFREIVDIAREHDVHIFCDEVYRYLEFDGRDRLPSIADVYGKGVSLGVMSKTFGLAGLRIGWIATKDKALLGKMASFKDYTSICSSAPSEFLSTLALRKKDHLIRRNLGIIGRNLRLLDRFFERYCDLFEWNRPKAGSIAFPRILFKGDSEEFCTDMVEKKGVLLMPSTKFDFGNKHFRVGFGRSSMPEALGRFEEYVKEELL